MKVKLVSLLVLAASALTGGVCQAAIPGNEVIVLVPGFFNSLVPGNAQNSSYQPYFSNDIVQVFQKTGHKVYIVNNLNPIGGIAENASHLETFLLGVVNANPGSQLSLVAHSAGGLYALQVANHSSLPIRQIAALATPFGGVQFIDNIEFSFVPLTPLIQFVALDSLNQLTTSGLAPFYDQLDMRSNLALKVYYGYQSLRNMSPPMATAQLIGDAPGDGIVTIASVMAAKQLTPFVQQSDYIHVEHWAQTMDYRLFAMFGENINQIRSEQIRFFTRIYNDL